MAPKAPRNAAAAAPAAAPAAVADYSVLAADDDDDDDADDSESDAAPAVDTSKDAKKAKAKAAKAAGAGAAGADGAAAGGEGWTTITDARRVRYEKSKVKKALEAQAELLRKQDMSNEEALEKALEMADRAAAKLTGTGFRIDAKGMKGPDRTDKKKKKNAGPKYVVISSEKQMVEVVTQVVSNVPNNHHLHLSAVGDKVQEMTNKSWKKAYAPTYGSLPEFFKKHSAQFYVDPNQRVMLRSEWNAVKAHAAVDPLKATDAPKKKKAKGQSAGAGAAGANGHGAVAKVGAGAAEAADDNVAFRVLLVVVLIIAVGIAVFCGLEGITFAQFVGRLRAAFRL